MGDFSLLKTKIWGRLIREHSQTTLTGFCLFLTTYPLSWQFLPYKHWQKVNIFWLPTHLFLSTKFMNLKCCNVFYIYWGRMRNWPSLLVFFCIVAWIQPDIYVNKIFLLPEDEISWEYFRELLRIIFEIFERQNL